MSNREVYALPQAAAPMDFGHVKISRKAYSADPFWNEARTFSRWEAWEWLIKEAAWKARRRVVGATVVELERGELLASFRFMADAWGWSVKKVRGFLALLQEMERIRAQRETHAGTVYLLVNYDTYQGSGQGEGTAGDTTGAQQGHSEGTAGAQTRSSKAGKAVEAREASSGKVVQLHGGVNVEAAADQIIMAANRGMNDNPSIPYVQPIHVGHGSRQAVLDWLRDGIDWEVARDTCYRLAKEYRPNDRRKQVGTMGYFDAAVRDAWDLERANRTEVRTNGAERAGGAGPDSGARGQVGATSKHDKYAYLEVGNGPDGADQAVRLRAG